VARRFTALAAFLLLAAPALADSTDAIRECGRHAQHRSGLAALEEACPELGPALDASGLRELLTPKSRDELTLGGLAAALAALDAARAAPARVPDTASLAPVLKDLGVKPGPATWWDRFKAWLRGLLGSPKSSRVPAWLASWLRNLSVPQIVLRVLMIGLLTAIVVAAVVLIVLEGRQLGGRWRPAPSPLRASPLPAARPLTLADVESAPPDRRARTLFQVLAQAFARSGRVSAERTRTHRELRRAVAAARPADAERFDRLAAAAEEELFGSGPVPSERLAQALADGGELYEELARAPGLAS